MKRQLTARIEVAKNGQFYAVLVAKNGEPLATTETQYSASTLKRTLKRNFPSFTVVVK